MNRYRVKMLGDGSIILPEEVLRQSGIQRDDEVEFYVGEGRIELHRVKPLRPFSMAHPLMELLNAGIGRRSVVSASKECTEGATTSGHAQNS